MDSQRLWRPRKPGGDRLSAPLQCRRRRTLCRRDHPGRGVHCLARRVAADQRRRPGFSYKWNMGWMHDTLHYMEQDPVHRKWHHNDMTFGLLYAFSEKFVLPLSHDEVVYGKRSLIGQDAGRQLAALRQSARLSWLHVGPSRQEAAVHGLRDRAGARMEPRRRTRLGCARRSAAAGRPAPGARSESALCQRAGVASARCGLHRVPLGRRRRSCRTRCSRSCATAM